MSSKRKPASNKVRKKDTQSLVRKVKPKPPAVLVKVAPGQSYADTVRAVRGANGINLMDIRVSTFQTCVKQEKGICQLTKNGKSKEAAARLHIDIVSNLKTTWERLYSWVNLLNWG